MSTTTMIVSELRALLRLTNTEIQIAETRRLQARTEAVERELARNADNARDRAQRIATVLRGAGGHPDVVTTAVGRLSAVAKSNLEQVQPITEALLGDLALEHQLQDRARLLVALGTAADDRAVTALGERLVEAHGATVEWLTVVLAEVALGGPAALRPTPVQQVLTTGLQVAAFPARTLGRGVDGAVDRAARARRRTEEMSDAVADSVTDAVIDVRDDVRATASDVASGTRDALRTAGSPRADKLPVTGFASMTKPRAITAVKGLKTPEDVRLVVAYEEAHRNRADVVSAAQVQLARLAEEVVLS